MRYLIKFLLSLLLFIFLTGFSGDNCFKCHKKKVILSGKFVHAPLKKGKCDKCHMVHASKFSNLLTLSPDDLCISCHNDVLNKIKNDKIIHLPVEKKACVRCHVSHSSNNKFLLKKSDKRLCFECHKDIEKKMKYMHTPFKKGQCLSCHTAHSSKDRRFLKKEGAEVCAKCHNIKNHKKKFLGKDCLQCHNPHGSSNKYLLRTVSHDPFKKGNCKVCHDKLNKKDLCISCHKNTLSDFNKLHNHLLGGIENNSCLICHNPHMGDDKSLLKDSPQRFCQKCHKETYNQKKKSLYIHPKWKDCTSCHNSHGSDNPSMLKGDGNSVCINCHKTQGKFTHPVGEKIRDPRNGQEITCVTCHDPMGTNFKGNLRLSGEGALCIECHKNY